ncbi:transmembrane protein, putative (macronuclear) [Tetrahymena thermophila SB210]|uniref:Transmembrane protein, putative n=1 Tax=Tetrahymena thermophila (strain SB210) TaxID=312017 RepID=W7XII3_TETTS|nr:transmembrane protein, putative [Tetrahymena thermophila SB210]EWS73304.1 transmembrane protein, putative [Tetrahymena thermophila SB210]|eukprot:XP_012654153.1 transmembrane protein, putative [Tetrahymena thermophila SB210]
MNLNQINIYLFNSFDINYFKIIQFILIVQNTPEDFIKVTKPLKTDGAIPGLVISYPVIYKPLTLVLEFKKVDGSLALSLPYYIPQLEQRLQYVLLVKGVPRFMKSTLPFNQGQLVKSKLRQCHIFPLGKFSSLAFPLIPTNRQKCPIPKIIVQKQQEIMNHNKSIKIYHLRNALVCYFFMEQVNLYILFQYQRLLKESQLQCHHQQQHLSLNHLQQQFQQLQLYIKLNHHLLKQFPSYLKLSPQYHLKDKQIHLNNDLAMTSNQKNQHFHNAVSLLLLIIPVFSIISLVDFLQTSEQSIDKPNRQIFYKNVGTTKYIKALQEPHAAARLDISKYFQIDSFMSGNSFFKFSIKVLLGAINLNGFSSLNLIVSNSQQMFHLISLLIVIFHIFIQSSLLPLQLLSKILFINSLILNKISLPMQWNPVSKAQPYSVYE